jgi:hypothetical protein
MDLPYLIRVWICVNKGIWRYSMLFTQLKTYKIEGSNMKILILKLVDGITLERGLLLPWSFHICNKNLSLIQEWFSLHTNGSDWQKLFELIYCGVLWSQVQHQQEIESCKIMCVCLCEWMRTGTPLVHSSQLCPSSLSYHN